MAGFYLNLDDVSRSSAESRIKDLFSRKLLSLRPTIRGVCVLLPIRALVQCLWRVAKPDLKCPSAVEAKKRSDARLLQLSCSECATDNLVVQALCDRGLAA